MAIKIVLANRKGGVGKTTTAHNLAAFLASMGYRVLGMDFDPQSSLTASFGINFSSLPLSLADVFEDKCSIKEVILSDRRNLNLDIVPSNPRMEKVIETDYVVNHRRKNELIKFKFGPLDKEYDFVIMDTGPSANTLTMNSLAMADYVVIPMLFAGLSTLGLKQMSNLIKELTVPWLNPKLQLLGLLGTFFTGTKGTKDARKHMAIIMDPASPFKDYPFHTKIRHIVALSESIIDGEPLVHYKKKCKGYDDYSAFTRELLDRLDAKHVLPVLEHAAL